jgi:citronellol/citronellal dehydrogenase
LEILADAAAIILSKPSSSYSGNLLLDEEVLNQEGIMDLSRYSVVPGAQLYRDLFLD